MEMANSSHNSNHHVSTTNDVKSSERTIGTEHNLNSTSVKGVNKKSKRNNYKHYEAVYANANNEQSNKIFGRTYRVPMKTLFEKGLLRSTYPNGFFSGGYYKYGRNRIRGPILYNNYHRYGRIYSYYPPQQTIDCGSSLEFRRQMPPDSDNFIYISLSNSNVLSEDYIPLPNTDMINKIELSEYKSIVHDIAIAYNEIVSPPICSLYCLIPIIGCYLHYSKQEGWIQDKRLDRVAQICQTRNQQYKESNSGLWIDFIYEDESFMGIVIRCKPYLNNGDINPKWTGSIVNMSEQEKKYYTMFENMELGEKLDDKIFEEMLLNNAEIGDNYAIIFDTVESLARKQLLFQAYGAINACAQPYFISAKEHLKAYSANHHINPNKALSLAKADLTVYKHPDSHPTGWTSELSKVSKLTNENIIIIQQYANNFQTFCALPVDIVYDENMIAEYLANHPDDADEIKMGKHLEICVPPHSIEVHNMITNHHQNNIEDEDNFKKDENQSKEEEDDDDKDYFNADVDDNVAIEMDNVEIDDI